MAERIFSFAALPKAPLVVDATYEGGALRDVRDDPLAPLLGGGNQGGFRYLGGVNPFAVRHCILYTDMSDADWPDRLDLETGTFTYFGDNKTPGHELHDTIRQGNLILREIFERLHSGRRREVPPIFVFTKGAKGRDVVFRGLAAPGGPNVGPTDDLVAVWKARDGRRFQNYKATFTILSVSNIERDWLDLLRTGSGRASAPEVWTEWVQTGRYAALTAPRTKEHRSPVEQLPSNPNDLALLRAIVGHYENDDEGRYGFERCAAELFRLLQPGVIAVDLTRRWRDGGRDALGLLQVGSPPSAINVEFALEAKCKAPAANNSSGVKETARLVARIRHRQFGVFVTTSCIAEQAYQELIEDGHPIVVVAGNDIVRILRDHGLATDDALNAWLDGIDRDRRRLA